MSTNVAKTVPIGPSQIYWNDVRLGFPMSQVAFRYTKNSIEGSIEDVGVVVASHKVSERMEVDVVLNDVKMDQGRYIYDQAAARSTRSTINTANYTATETVVYRMREAHKLNATTNITLDGAGFEAGTISVFKSDYSAEYTSSTDFTSAAAAGTVARISGGSITDGETVYIEYNQSATGASIYGGGELVDFEATMRIVHKLDNGKYLQLYLHRAKHIGASDWAIQIAGEFGGIPMTFLALADMAQAPGKQLFRFSVET